METKLTVKRSLVSDVVDEQNSHGAPVVRNSNGTEPFLTSSVPLVVNSGEPVISKAVWIATYDLEFDSLSIELDGTYLEVDSDCGDE